MTRTISDIYEHYQTPPWLAEHMLRVAAVAKLICDNSTTSVRTDDVVSACLLHDMGNIIKFQLEKFPEFFTPEKGLAYWQAVQEDYFQKYGRDEHAATVTIAREIGAAEKVRIIIDCIGLSELPVAVESGALESKIGSYSDMRVGPHGVLPLQERLADLHKRNKEKGRFNAETAAFEREQLHKFEKDIFDVNSMTPGDVTDLSVAGIIDELRQYPIAK